MEEHLAAPQTPRGSQGTRGLRSHWGREPHAPVRAMHVAGVMLRLTSRFRATESLPESARQLLRWRTGELAVLHTDYLRVWVVFKCTYKSYRHLSL